METNIDINVAYTQEYQALRASYDWLFETNETVEDTIVLGDGKYLADVFSYRSCRTVNGSERYYLGTRIQIRDKNGREITHFKMIEEDLVFLELVEHQNGKEYLIFRKDLYGYSVMDIAAGNTVDFIPKKSFIPPGGTSREEETFIACYAKYCKAIIFWFSTDVTGHAPMILNFTISVTR